MAERGPARHPLPACTPAPASSGRWRTPGPRGIRRHPRGSSGRRSGVLLGVRRRCPAGQLSLFSTSPKFLHTAPQPSEPIRRRRPAPWSRTYSSAVTRSRRLAVPSVAQNTRYVRPTGCPLAPVEESGQGSQAVWVSIGTLALTMGQSGQAGAAGDAAYFNMRDITGHNFVIEITRPEVIKEAGGIVRSGNPRSSSAASSSARPATTPSGTSTTTRTPSASPTRPSRSATPPFPTSRTTWTKSAALPPRPLLVPLDRPPHRRSHASLTPFHAPSCER